MSNKKKSQVTKNPAPPPVRYDWYQTDTDVVICLLLKNAIKRNYKVHFEREQLRVTTADSNGQNKFFIKLAHAVNTELCTHKAYKSKIELKLVKANGARWNTLERLTKAADSSSPPADAAPPPMYKTNWERIIKDWEEAEKNVAKRETQEVEKFLDEFHKKQQEELDKFFSTRCNIMCQINEVIIVRHHK